MPVAEWVRAFLLWGYTRLVAWISIVTSGALIIVCYLVSKHGVDKAIASCSSNDGGRGGAVAVMLAIPVIFLTPSYASRLYRKLSKSRGAEAFTIGTLLEALDDDAKYVRLQNLLFAIATLIGTYYWGFGDQIASKAIMTMQGCKH